MPKNAISLHLSDLRKERLDALVDHSEFEGHGAQSEYLRALIDQAASEHPRIDFESPSESITDDEWRYNPELYEGILEKEQCREILNSEKAPAINPEHVPPAWEPNSKKGKRLLMAAYFRYFQFYTFDIEEEGESVHTCVEYVLGKVEDPKRKNIERKQVKALLERYGIKPSNVIIVDDLDIEVWCNNMRDMIKHKHISKHAISERIESGKEYRLELSKRDEDRVLSLVEETLSELKKEKEELS